MNILLINHYAGSDEMGMEFRPFYMAKEWIKLGHQVTIIAGSYSHLRRKNPEIEHDLQETSCDGVKYIWLKTANYDNNGAKRAISMLQFCSKLYLYRSRIISISKPDIVISSSTYPIDSFPANTIAKKAKAKYVHEVHDMWPSTLIEAGGMSKHHPFVILMQWGENHAYKRADRVISLMQHAKDYMISHGLKENKFSYVPNGIIWEEWNNPLPLSDSYKEIFQQLRDKGKFVVGYFGSHEMSYGLFTLLEIGKKMEKQSVEIVLVGKGTLKDDLIQYAKEHQISNVTFMDPVPKKMIPSLTEQFDAVYISTIDSPLYRFGICMNKMYDSMMAAKPIIFAITTPGNPVTESGCGIQTKSEEQDAIIRAISTIQSMSFEERKQMGFKGRNAIMEHYTYEKIALKFIDEIMK